MKRFPQTVFGFKQSHHSDHISLCILTWRLDRPGKIISYFWPKNLYMPMQRNYRVLHRANNYSLPSLKPSQSLSFEEERAVENKSRSPALLLQLSRRLKASCAPWWSVAKRSLHDYSLPSLELSLFLSRSLFLSLEKERALEKITCSLSLQPGLGKPGHARPTRAPEKNVNMRELAIVSRITLLAPAPLRTRIHKNMVSFFAKEKQNTKSYTLAWRPGCGRNFKSADLPLNS